MDVCSPTRYVCKMAVTSGGNLKEVNLKTFACEWSLHNPSQMRRAALISRSSNQPTKKNHRGEDSTWGRREETIDTGFSFEVRCCPSSMYIACCLPRWNECSPQIWCLFEKQQVFRFSIFVVIQLEALELDFVSLAIEQGRHCSDTEIRCTCLVYGVRLKF